MSAEAARKLREDARKLLEQARELEDMAALCPHPPEHRIIQSADETFQEREGCLACNVWFNKPRLWSP